MKSAVGNLLHNGSVAEEDNDDPVVDTGGDGAGEGGDGGEGGVDRVPQPLGRRWEGGGGCSRCILQVFSIFYF